MKDKDIGKGLLGQLIKGGSKVEITKDRSGQGKLGQIGEMKCCQEKSEKNDLFMKDKDTEQGFLEQLSVICRCFTLSFTMCMLNLFAT